MFGIKPLQIKEYNGENFPKIIKELLYNPKKIIFGGSSLIHDLYFQSEDWGERDYDLWCVSSEFFKLKHKLFKDKNCKKIKEETFKYSHLKMEGISEYLYKISDEQSIKIQIINVGKSFEYMINNLDFSFISVIYDGENIHFLKTTEKEIMEKSGNVLSTKTNFCSCNLCHTKTDISAKTIGRIIKYKNRGFTFQNICPFCPNNQILSPNHIIKCQLKQDTNKYLLTDISNENEKITEIAKSQNPEIILCCLSIYARFLEMEQFINLFNEKKYLLNGNSENFKTLTEGCLRNGQYTFFKLLLEIDNYDEEKLIRQMRDIGLTKFGDRKLRKDVHQMILDFGLIDSLREFSKDFEYSVPTDFNQDEAHLAKLRLDYAYITPSLRKHLKSSKIIRNEETNQLSDHFPILIELDL